MAQKSPELYLSLLSGRYGDVSHLSAEGRDNDAGSHIHAGPFRKDPDRLLNVLDALAAICVQKEKGDVFFVSLNMDSNTATLYVSTNGTVPATVTTHLHKIQGQLKELKSVLEPGPPADIDSPDPNSTPSRSEGELKLRRTIYEHSYKKIQRRYQKRGPEIIAQFDTKSLYGKVTVDPADTELLTVTKTLLQDIGDYLKEKNPHTNLIETIAGLSMVWKKHLDSVEENSLLSQWDSLTCKCLTSHL